MVQVLRCSPFLLLFIYLTKRRKEMIFVKFHWLSNLLHGDWEFCIASFDGDGDGVCDFIDFDCTILSSLPSSKPAVMAQAPRYSSFRILFIYYHPSEESMLYLTFHWLDRPWDPCMALFCGDGFGDLIHVECVILSVVRTQFFDASYPILLGRTDCSLQYKPGCSRKQCELDGAACLDGARGRPTTNRHGSCSTFQADSSFGMKCGERA